MCRRVLGSENPLTLDALTNLALVYSEVGNYDAALPLSEEVVATTRRTRGADCEEAAHAIGSLAAVLNNVGEYARGRSGKRRGSCGCGCSGRRTSTR